MFMDVWGRYAPDMTAKWSKTPMTTHLTQELAHKNPNRNLTKMTGLIPSNSPGI